MTFQNGMHFFAQQFLLSSFHAAGFYRIVCLREGNVFQQNQATRT
jgi:hypothetical protein